MTDTIQPIENVARGTTFALLVIPVAIVAFGVVAGISGIFSGIVAIAVPYVAAWLYGKGAGTPLTRKGWGPFVAVSAAAILLGTFAGFVGGAYAAYSSVGGDGGIFAPALWTTVGNQLTRGLGDSLISILLGLGLGAAGIVSVLRGGTLGRRANPAVDAAIKK